jgi:hypothetical protein
MFACNRSLRNKRGRTVVLVFSNQGLGNLTNTAIILALMAITGQYGPHYSTSAPGPRPSPAPLLPAPSGARASFASKRPSGTPACFACKSVE